VAFNFPAQTLGPASVGLPGPNPCHKAEIKPGRLAEAREGNRKRTSSQARAAATPKILIYFC
jgi:hypothetical protein